MTEQAPDLLKEIVMKRTSLGEDARRNNARTGGSVKLEHVTLDKIDGNGLEFTCSVKSRAGGFGGGAVATTAFGVATTQRATGCERVDRKRMAMRVSRD